MFGFWCGAQVRKFFLRSLREEGGEGVSGAAAAVGAAVGAGEELGGPTTARENREEKAAVDKMLYRAPLRVGRLREMAAGVAFTYGPSSQPPPPFVWTPTLVLCSRPLFSSVPPSAPLSLYRKVDK